ncbi:MAG: VWA domain-containing protein, partial [Thermoanaerobaculia bacterium]
VPTAPPSQPVKEAPAHFSDTISVGYAMISFAVADRRGRAVSTLQAKDVSLLVDGKTVVTDMFERVENAPISFTILLDGSGSMGLAGKMDGARMAVATLLGLRRKNDDFALFVFSQGEVQEVVPFTKDPNAILHEMNVMEPWGKTAFYDALAAMPDKTLLGENGAKSIILITDGLDNASSMSREDLATALEGVSVPIYPLTIRFPIDPALPSDDEQGLDLQLLQQIADASGGRMAVETDVPSLQAAVKAMHGDLRSQYLIGFTPTGKGGVKYRRFTIRLAKSSWKVRARAGYSGSEPPFRQTSRKR